MKKILVLLLLLSVYQVCLAQKKNSIKFIFGFSDAYLAQKLLTGGAGYTINNFNEFGLRYAHSLTSKFSLETGINYAWADITITSAPMPTQTTRDEKLQLLSFPIYGKYDFGKYFWVNGGPILDFQQSNNSSDKQSGIGYSLGIGSQIYFKSFSLFVNPNFKKHDFITFEAKKHQQRLTELGVQFGLSHQF